MYEDDESILVEPYGDTAKKISEEKMAEVTKKNEEAAKAADIKKKNELTPEPLPKEESLPEST
jgi:hypothetical protein